MTSNKKKAIAWSVVVVLLIAVALTLQWYHSPGVHILGPMVRIELSQKCFIMDADTGEILEESWLQVYMDGNFRNGSASGMARVDGYPIEGDGIMGIGGDRKDMTVSHSGIIGVPDDTAGIKTDPSRYTYIFAFADGLVGLTLVDRESTPDDPTKVAICAYTPEEAQARLPKIVECIFGIAENP